MTVFCVPLICVLKSYSRLQTYISSPSNKKIKLKETIDQRDSDLKRSKYTSTKPEKDESRIGTGNELNKKG